MSILLLYPNPYAAIDHNGLLAGRCAVAEEVRPGDVMPVGAFVGSTLVHVSTEIRDPHAEGVEGMPVGPKHHYECRFSSDPTPVRATAGALGSYWACRLAGEPEVFRAEDDGGPPLEKMAAARLDAIEKYRASYGTEPPVEKWAKQFELDEAVAEVAKTIAEQRKVAQAKAKTDAEKAQTDAKKAVTDAGAARSKLIDAAKRRASDRLNKPAGPQPPLPAKGSEPPLIAPEAPAQVTTKRTAKEL